MMKYGVITCKRCGVSWYGPKCGKLYCDSCRKIVNREKNKKCKNKKKNNNLSLIEITRLADAAGMSYAKYCLKYGI